MDALYVNEDGATTILIPDETVQRKVLGILAAALNRMSSHFHGDARWQEQGGTQQQAQESVGAILTPTNKNASRPSPYA